jgi:hypothetical protein
MILAPRPQSRNHPRHSPGKSKAVAATALEGLNCSNTAMKDLEAVKGLPLTRRYCGGVQVSTVNSV